MQKSFELRAYLLTGSGTEIVASVLLVLTLFLELRETVLVPLLLLQERLSELVLLLNNPFLLKDQSSLLLQLPLALFH